MFTEVLPHTKAVVSVRYSLSGNCFATASADGTACVLDCNSGAVLQTLQEHSLGLNDVIWIDDALVATCSDDKTAKVWDVERGISTATLSGHKGLIYCLAEDFYTRNLYTGGYDGSVIIYDPCSRSSLCTFSAHSESITSMSCSMIGTDFVTGSYDGLIRIWDNRSMACCKFTLANAKNTSVSSTRFSENGRYLLASFMDNTHVLYDMIHQSAVVSSNSSSSNSNSNNGSSSSGGGSNIKNSYSNHYNVVDSIYGAYTLPPRPIKCYTGHQNSRYSIFSDFYQCVYGKYIISGSEDGKIYMWNVGDRKIAHTLSGHEGTVFAVAGQPNLDLPPKIVSCGENGSLKIWDLNNLLNRNPSQISGDYMSDNADSNSNSDIQMQSDEMITTAWDNPIVDEERASEGGGGKEGGDMDNRDNLHQMDESLSSGQSLSSQHLNSLSSSKEDSNTYMES